MGWGENQAPRVTATGSSNTGGLKAQRPGDQPLPTARPGAPDVQSMVLTDLEARRQVGIQRYGTALQTNNGRDMLRDAYEEALDLCVYLRGVIAERDEAATPRPYHLGHEVDESGRCVTCGRLVD